MRTGSGVPTSDKKIIERAYAEQVARQLGVIWRLGADRETPDFLVETEQGGRFGLEVTTAYADKRSKKAGSSLLEGELFRESWLLAIRDAFTAVGGPSLHVRYYGSSTGPTRANEITAALLAFAQRTDRGVESLWHDFADGRLFAFETPHRSWHVASDRARTPYVDGQPLQNSIDAKKKRLGKYREICSDIRLLVVATSIYDSGNIEIPENFRPDLQGFDAVYFYSYPRLIRAFFPVNDEGLNR